MDPLHRLRTALADRYTLQHEIGRGGMAIVYLAHDLRHSRSVAIKVLRPEFAMAVSAERFLREIQIEGQLKHPCILPLFDSGEVDGLPYYVTPYVAGQSLQARLLRDSQLSVPEAIRIAGEVASALAYAHERGFVHRDVKPGNILMGEGHAVLADFGIARAVTEVGGDRLSESGLVVGTPEYMSPEQGAAHGRVDRRSDVYSLGCVLYEMLSGEPPFTGPTAQAIIARHMHERVRSLRVVRSTVPEHVEEAIQIALAKVPADRFDNVEQFMAAVGPEGEAAASARRARRVRRRMLTRAGPVAAVILLGAAGLWTIMPRPPTLDPNKVVLFPLAERGLTSADSGAGYDVAVMLSAALDHAQPLKWIDGAPRLAAFGAASGKSQLAAHELRKIARTQGAGFYIEGAVLSGASDSSTVILRLHDTRGDSVVAQEMSRGVSGSASPVQLGLEAATRLLPALLDPGRKIDLTPLSVRKPSATALWIQGEREYRRSRFQSALNFYQRAVREDSALVLAAIKGAQAAGWVNWEDLGEEAQQLLAVALARPSLLPSKHQWFARGWNAYLLGQADSAARWLEQAVIEDPEWAEGHMALGEVYYHLLPRAPHPLDSLAYASFRKAVQYDSGFAPPLFHLAELAIRQDSLLEAQHLIERFRRFQPDSARWYQLAIMHSCVRNGLTSVNWERETGRNPMAVQNASRSLAVGGAQNDCAERGFRAVLANPAQAELHWGAFLGLHGVIMTERRYTEIGPLINSAVALNLGRAPLLYFVDDLAGAPVEARAESTAAAWRTKYGNHYEGVSPQSRWLLAAWAAHHRDTAFLKDVHAVALREPPSDVLPFMSALEGFLALARADTAAAVRKFRTLRFDVPSEVLEWGLVEPLAVERLILAESALARRDFREALGITGVFDHPAPVAYLPFLPQALSIRLQAARGLDQPVLIDRYQGRMRALQNHAELTLGAKISR